MFTLLKRFSGKEILMIFVAVVFIAVGVWLDINILPDYTEKIVGAISPSDSDLNSPAGEMSDVWRYGGLMLAAAFGSVITIIVVGYIAAKISASFSARLRKDIFTKVGTFSTEEMKKFSVASLITRSTNDVTQVRMFVAMGMQMLIKSPITAVWAVIRILDKSKELSMVTAVAVVALVTVIMVMIVLVLPRFKKIQMLTDELNRVARENLTGIRVVRAYNAEKFEEDKFEHANDKVLRNNLFTMRTMGLMMPFMQLLMSGMALGLWWLGGSLIDSGNNLAPQSIMAFQQISFQIIMSFMMLIIVFVMLPRVAVSAKRINEIFHISPSIIDGALCNIDSAGQVLSNVEQSSNKVGQSLSKIEFKNVGFKYPDASGYVLKDVNLKIEKGQTVAFIGSTGSGKSTLVNLLARLYDATEGEVLVDGINVKNLTQETLHDKVGYIPQTAVVFQGTIASNIAFGTVNGKEISENEIKRALDVAQASEFVSKMEKGIHSEISQRGKNLSGGQKQRLAIARVIARNPEVFIFDDTFSALDYKTDKSLREALKQNCAGSTVLIVAQRIGTIKDADLIVVLDNGIIIGQGKHKELLKNCKVYQQIAFSQLSKEELA